MYSWRFCFAYESTNALVHNIFGIAGRITFIFMNTAASEFKMFLFFALLLFCLHTMSLIPHAGFAVFLLCILIQ